MWYFEIKSGFKRLAGCTWRLMTAFGGRIHNGSGGFVTMGFLSDIEIAQQYEAKDIRDIAK
ncbi:hypothetical protein, partial [Faecalispora jeddahensis]|uniref:hypothetical protein n=1 Tax=Faecalispora jeddahensis TaxID=1414721 RepID=UPI001A9AA6B8